MDNLRVISSMPPTRMPYPPSFKSTQHRPKTYQQGLSPSASSKPVIEIPGFKKISRSNSTPVSIYLIDGSVIIGVLVNYRI